LHIKQDISFRIKKFDVNQSYRISVCILCVVLDIYINHNLAEPVVWAAWSKA